jgi:hypothetical protein
MNNMRFTTFVITFFCFLFAGSSGNAQIFNWGKQFPMTYAGFGPYIQVDDSSLIIGGTLFGNLSLDSTVIRNNSFDPYSFIARQDPDRNIKWAHLFDGPADNYLYESALDTKGNIIVGGSYEGQINIVDTMLMAEEDFMTSMGCPYCYRGNEAYITKVDRQGEILWARTFYGLDNQMVEKVKVDSHDNPIIVATCSHVFKIENSIYWTADTSRYKDKPFIYLLKYSPDGKLIWVYGFDSQSRIMDILLDAQNNIYLIFSRDMVTSNIVKFDSEGNKIFDIGFSDPNIFLLKGTFDLSGNLVLSGKHKIDDQSLTTILIKINAEGDLLYWAKEYPGMREIITMAHDKSGNLYIGGAEHDGDYYYAKFDCKGDLVSWISPGIKNQGYIQDIINYKNDIYISGRYYVTTDSLEIGDTTFTSSYSNMFVTSFTDTSKVECYDYDLPTACNFSLINYYNPTTEIKNKIPFNIAIYPTIVTNDLHINLRKSLENRVDIEIVNITGVTFFKQKFFIPSDIRINCSSMPEGIYLVIIRDSSGIQETYKILIDK